MGVLGRLTGDRSPRAMLLGKVQGFLFIVEARSTWFVGSTIGVVKVTREFRRSIMAPNVDIHVEPRTRSASHNVVMLRRIGSGVDVGEIVICVST